MTAAKTSNYSTIVAAFLATLVAYLVFSAVGAAGLEAAESTNARLQGGVGDRAPVVSIEGAPRIESYYEYHYFGFSADVPGSAFYCSLDDEPFASCTTNRYRYVPYSEHLFRVYAVSPDGKRGGKAVVGYESRDPNWD